MSHSSAYYPGNNQFLVQRRSCIPNKKIILTGSVLLIYLISFTACRTVLLYDTSTFVHASTLKARVLVIMDHGTEKYASYADKTDEILIETESIYAMQKARNMEAAKLKI